MRLMDNTYTIGIVGGMGTYATIAFFKRLADAYIADKEWERPRIIIDNYCTLPSRVRAALYNERRDELVAKLSDSINNLINAGSTRIVLACNTSHIFIPEVCSKLNIDESKIVNIIDECGKQMSAEGVEAAYILASEGTIESRIYETTMNKYNIVIHNPVEDEYDKIRYYIECVKKNNLSSDVLKDFSSYLNNCNDNDIILGCTELPILYEQCKKNKYDIHKDIYDPLESVINVFVSEYVKE